MHGCHCFRWQERCHPFCQYLTLFACGYEQGVWETFEQLQRLVVSGKRVWRHYPLAQHCHLHPGCNFSPLERALYWKRRQTRARGGGGGSRSNKSNNKKWSGDRPVTTTVLLLLSISCPVSGLAVFRVFVSRAGAPSWRVEDPLSWLLAAKHEKEPALVLSDVTCGVLRHRQRMDRVEITTPRTILIGPDCAVN